MRHTTRGFTLIELMTALLVLGVLTAMAVPSFRDMSRNNRVAAAQTDLVTALAVARSEALTRSTTVSVCASSNSATCTGTNDWSTGWIVITDTGTAGTVDSTDVPLQVWAPTVGDAVLTSSDAFVRYAPTGRLLNPAGATASFDIYTTGCKGDRLRHVTITPVGTASTTRKSCP